MSDFQIADRGSIISIRPLNEAARQWLDENVVSEPWQWVQGALCVEARFARDLIIEIEEAGFEIALNRCRTLRRCALRGAAASQHSCCDMKEALMGAVCIEAEEGLNPYTLGTGAKEGEQGFSRPATRSTIKMPASIPCVIPLPESPVTM